MLNKNTLWRVAALASVASLAICLLPAQQQPTMGTIDITRRGKPTIAIPDLKGSGQASAFMSAFNSTLWSDVQAAGMLTMAPKSFYPIQVPQQPTDFRPPVTAAPTRRDPNPQPVRQGPWFTDWSTSPVNANYLAFGYTAVQDDRLVLLGWMYDLTKPDPTTAQVIGKRYFGSIDEAGARDVAHQFAADILAQFGAKSLAGTKIYYVHQIGSNKEVFSMDYDGNNSKQITRYNSISITPAVDKEGRTIAFTSYSQGQPLILLHSVLTGRRLSFLNQRVSLNTTPEFTPDGQRVLFSSTAGGNGFANLFEAGLDGSGLRRLTSVRAIEVEPKVNPATGNEVVFTSGRSGPSQIYLMNRDGGDVQRLTSGEGQATNPSWSPDGKRIAFAWTRGFEPGNFNIFIMDVATRNLVQLTHGAGRNENPVWAPDGVHIAFQSNRAGGSQIFTMRADGSDIRQITTQGRNFSPVWR